MNNTILPHLSKLSLLIAMAFSSVACDGEFEDKGVPTLVIAPTSHELIYTEAGTQAIKIETNRDWKAFLETPVEWLELSKESGSGDDVITVTAAAGARQESATLVIALYNQVGVMLSESISITRCGDGTASPIVEKFTLTRDALGISTANASGTASFEGVDWEYVGVSATDSFGTMYIELDDPAPGFIKNTSALTGMASMKVVGNGFINSNLLVTVGSTPDSMTELKSVSPNGSGWGSEYTYEFPSGTKYVNFACVPGETHDAAVTTVTFYGTQDGSEL